MELELEGPEVDEFGILLLDELEDFRVEEDELVDLVELDTSEAEELWVGLLVVWILRQRLVSGFRI